MKTTINTLMLVLSLLMAACQETDIRPQDPLWERESCARCRMILSEKRFAVQRILKTGEVHYYDDMNCALKHGHKDDEGTLFVRPLGSEKWMPATDVKYESGLRTPMNSGYGAVLKGGQINFSEIKEKFKD